MRGVDIASSGYDWGDAVFPSVTQRSPAVWTLKGKSLPLATQYDSSRAINSGEFAPNNMANCSPPLIHLYYRSGRMNRTVTSVGDNHNKEKTAPRKRGKSAHKLTHLSNGGARTSLHGRSSPLSLNPGYAVSLESPIRLLHEKHNPKLETASGRRPTMHFNSLPCCKIYFFSVFCKHMQKKTPNKSNIILNDQFFYNHPSPPKMVWKMSTCLSLPIWGTFWPQELTLATWTEFAFLWLRAGSTISQFLNHFTLCVADAIGPARSFFLQQSWLYKAVNWVTWHPRECESPCQPPAC